MTEREDLKIENQARNIVVTEFKFWIFLIGAALTVAVPYFTMQKDIALIQQSIENINGNHEVHIQDILEQLKDMKAKDEAQDEKLQANQEQIIKLLTILGK